jgi:hypothetical protein
MKNQFSLLAWSDFYWLRTVGPVLKSQIVSNLKWKYKNPEDNIWDFVVTVIFKSICLLSKKYDCYSIKILCRFLFVWKIVTKKSHWSKKIYVNIVYYKQVPLIMYDC